MQIRPLPLRCVNRGARIVTFAYEQKLATGEYPTNLADYGYHDPEMKTYIQQFRGDADVGAFVLCYRVGTESIYHCRMLILKNRRNSHGSIEGSIKCHLAGQRLGFASLKCECKGYNDDET